MLFRKKWLFSMMIIAGISIVMAGCGDSKAALSPDKINVVASFYPLYDFTKKIGGDHVNVINLVPTGVEPHDWSPKGRDMQNISRAQMFLYLGAGFEGWVDDTLSSLQKDSKVTVVEASKGLSLIEAAEEEVQEAKGKADSHNHTTTEHGHVDPHVWLSPLNAKQMALTIKDQLVKIDAAHKADYEANYTKYAAQLDQLHNQYKQALTPLTKKQIVVTHQSFAYLTKEYGLTQKPIMGLSPDAEPTSKGLQEINEFIRTNNVKYIFFEELVSDRLAKTLAKDAKVETMVLNPIEGLTDEQTKAGADYISLMQVNLKNLIKALQ
ncbi:metal ABC transporter substrate-binding protein [Paenibacillus sp. FSL H7-0331]|uniref:metal ABC transporter substrate-binding protein n=1 Tax=Paenibacillus sp. FSL H7-0331 TaxID=1920421 RepID=UPI00096DDC1B|nr:metal ABC transporter substrate-binding protein [Paenibacillus sp. FSL H7-0331]OMF18211.1 ABC transporter substrate-binding protein [Paenibacillus sp. FSL H7-0331]